jgi:hypothetical protein
VRLGREFDALRVAFSLGTFFWRSKSKVPRRRGETREVDFAVGFVGFKVVSTRRHPLTRMMFCIAASARRTGKRACLAKPSFTSQATPASMACGCPPGPTLLRHA